MADKIYVLLDDVIAHIASCERSDMLPVECSAITLIKNVPAADVVEVRHGNWIPNSSNTRWICSECGIDDNYAYNYSGVNFSLKLQDFYCPNCGAKMDGGQDDV